ncbi:putative effector of murein hydrolase LrgA (UPF0299 family) [Hoeflea marina]|uniref:Putative effector of murein hydrolase LrgA (UPF0299 family) n=1 Tax=Hoeflea marina TaxID=274592 RepID=A0A317PWL7_9HYPH|nr:CidA/LrgA family protein [Hoeflea marina]PWW03870.1 putative effector of murein hydrolase LrgA (UPF0299 family) [Hoeflea marina]
MLASLTLILGCQLAGELFSQVLALPIPGPVIGMVILFAMLMIRGQVPAPLQATADGLLSHLSLLFVPAGVGVMVHLHLMAENWWPITAALIGSTLATIAVTALVMVWIDRLTGKAAEGESDA